MIVAGSVGGGKSLIKGFLLFGLEGGDGVASMHMTSSSLCINAGLGSCLTGGLNEGGLKGLFHISVVFAGDFPR